MLANDNPLCCGLSFVESVWFSHTMILFVFGGLLGILLNYITNTCIWEPRYMFFLQMNIYIWIIFDNLCIVIDSSIKK